MNYIKLKENETLDKKRCVAEADIECFKIIEERLTSSGRYEYLSFPLYYNIPEEVINGQVPFCPKHEIVPKVCEDGVVMFGDGFIHAYESIEDAIQYMEEQTYGYAETRPTIYRCVIPKGTIYYRTFKTRDESEPAPCYAALSVRFGEPLLERVYGKTRDYKRMEKQETKKKVGIRFVEEYSEEDENLENEE